MWLGIFNTCGGIGLNEIGQNRETNEKHNEDCVEEGFHLTRVKFEGDGEGDKVAVNMGNRSINV